MAQDCTPRLPSVPHTYASLVPSPTSALHFILDVRNKMEGGSGAGNETTHTHVCVCGLLGLNVDW